MAKILLVEDDPDMLELARLTLEFSGFVVDLACDGLEMVDRLLHNRYDLLLVDFKMPKMWGAEVVLRMLKGELPNTPYIFLTAERSRLPNILFDDDEILLKPYAPDDLVKRIDQKIIDGGDKDNKVMPRPLSFDKKYFDAKIEQKESAPNQSEASRDTLARAKRLITVCWSLELKERCKMLYEQ